MKKYQVEAIWSRYEGVSLVFLGVATIFFAGLSIYALRSNNVRMLELRQAVYNADEAGKDVEKPLNELRTFVFAHMNTTLRPVDGSEAPIQLVNSYNRAVEAEQQKIERLIKNSPLYSTAQAECAKARLSNSQERAQCIEDYVRNFGNIPDIQLPQKEFYTFDFVSPRWSPDLAGWAIVATIVCGLLFMVRLFGGFIIKLYIKK
jgi:hypothetical protein